VSETARWAATESRPPPEPESQPDDGAAAEFARLYRSQVAAVTAFFARRTTDPQVVADLTSDTFVQVISSFGGYDPAKGDARPWVFGIARRVYARHCDAYRQDREKVRRLANHRVLDSGELAELADRIDAERVGRELIAALATLSDLDREVVELVDIAGLRPAEAARALGVSAGSTRMRLMRARTRLRAIATNGRGDSDE